MLGVMEGNNVDSQGENNVSAKGFLPTFPILSTINRPYARPVPKATFVSHRRKKKRRAPVVRDTELASAYDCQRNRKEYYLTGSFVSIEFPHEQMHKQIDIQPQRTIALSFKGRFVSFGAEKVHELTIVELSLQQIVEGY
jgi:hypothetical protein